MISIDWHMICQYATRYQSFFRPIYLLLSGQTFYLDLFLMSISQYLPLSAWALFNQPIHFFWPSESNHLYYSRILIVRNCYFVG